MVVTIKWDKVFKNGPSKIYERQNLKNWKGYGLLKETISLQIFQRLSSTDFTSSIHDGPFLNILSHMATITLY